jgi:GAF domain-containing protein
VNPDDSECASRLEILGKFILYLSGKATPPSGCSCLTIRPTAADFDDLTEFLRGIAESVGSLLERAKLRRRAHAILLRLDQASRKNLLCLRQ